MKLLNANRLWMLDPRILIEGLNLRGKIQLSAITQDESKPGIVDGGIAILNLHGILERGQSIMSWLYGGTDTQAAIDFVRSLDTKQIKALVLDINSPGGSADGIADLSDAIYDFRQKRPVYAYITSMAASGGYWIASQATKAYASSRMDMVGNIGVYNIIYDYSDLYNREGVKTILVTTGEYKALGAEGATVTPEQVAHIQEIVDKVFAEFKNALVRGREVKESSLKDFLTGKIYFAGDVKGTLVDGVMGRNDFAQRLAKFRSSNSQQAINQARMNLLGLTEFQTGSKAGEEK